MATIIPLLGKTFRPLATSGLDPREVLRLERLKRNQELTKELHQWQMENYSPEDINDSTFRPLVLGYYAFFLAIVCKKDATRRFVSELFELNKCLRMMAQQFDRFNAQTLNRPMRQRIKRRVKELHEYNWQASYQNALFDYERYYKRLGDSAEVATARSNARYGYIVLRVLARYLREAEERTSARYGQKVELPMQKEVAWLEDYFKAVMAIDYEHTATDTIIEGIIYNKCRSITAEDVQSTININGDPRDNEQAVWWDYQFRTT